MADELERLRTQLQHVRGALPSRIDVDPDGVERGLAQLVLTLVEFVRQLLERQAVRRMEGGSLSDEEVERVGLALMKLEEKVHELADHFGLGPGDLNINLGPLGDLL
jgi:gas vesicle protein GvpK